MFIDGLIGSDAVWDDSIGPAQYWHLPLSDINAIPARLGASYQSFDVIVTEPWFGTTFTDGAYRVTFGYGT